MRPLNIYLTTALIMLFAVSGSFAQTYSLTTTIDIAAGLSSTPRITRDGMLERRYANTGTGASSLRLSRTGQKTTFDVRYAYGLTRTQSDIYIETETHSATMNAVTRLSRNLQLRVTDTYFRSPNLISFNFTRGVIGVEAEPYLDFGTIIHQRKTTANTARADFQYTSGPRSLWSFGMGHNVHRLENAVAAVDSLENALAAAEPVDSMVQQFVGDVAYRRQLTDKTSWGTGLSVTQYDFQQRPAHNTRAYAMRIGLAHRLSETAVVDMAVGPSYRDVLHPTDRPERIGYNAKAGITKILGKNKVSLNYVRRNGATSGVADNQIITFDHARQFGRFVNLHTAASVYDSKQQRVTTQQIRGGTVAIIAGFVLSPNLTLSVGGNYQKQQGEGNFRTDRRQVGVFLRFTPPTIGRGQQ